MITKEIAQKVLTTVDAGLVSGLGRPILGQMGIEAAVCYALRLPHGDNPKDCVASSLIQLKTKLNDGFSSNKTRTKGLRKLALLQLGTAGVLNEVEFVNKLTLLVITKYLPSALKTMDFNKEATACEQAKDLNEAKKAARTANTAVRTANVVDAVAYAAYTDYAAYVTTGATVYNPPAVDADDKVLTSFAEDVAQILISMDVPGIQWLDLL